MSREKPGLSWLDGLGPQVIRPGLARVQALLASLGHPERSFRSILIAGTNGKGSTAALTASILHAHGVRTGLYTSPHLVRVNERIRIAETDISDDSLDGVLAVIKSISGTGALRPTYFESLTVAAFELFRQKRVDVAVVEVGIGGQWDATNVLDPDASAVTNVGADHFDVLGPALEDVARQKAGVFRKGRPALTAEGSACTQILAGEARRIGAPFSTVPPESGFDSDLPLSGAHQRSNLALALALAGHLLPLRPEESRLGVRNVKWPGRLQWVRRFGRRPLLLDGAHNPDGAEVLARYLDDQNLAGRADLIFGALADKDINGILAPLRGKVRSVTVVSPPSPRAIPAQELAARLGLPLSCAAGHVRWAIQELESRGTPVADPIIVAGSLYLVGGVLSLLERQEV